MDNDSKPTDSIIRSRRTLLKNAAATGTLFGTGALAAQVVSGTGSTDTNPVGTLDARYRFYRSDHAPYGNGGDMVMGLPEFDPVALPDVGNWTIPIQISLNAVHRNCSSCGVNDEIDTCYNQFRWPNRPNIDVYSDTSNNKFYTGAATNQMP